MILLDVALSTTILLSVAVFLLVTLLLVAGLLYTKQKLTPEGLLTVSVNDGERLVETEAGSSLLTVLSSHKIFLPSACGGGATCGMCRCEVTEGAGTVLPTETGFFTRKELSEHWRLACQVKVREDVFMKIPHHILGIKKWECEVISNNNVATFIKEFVVKLPNGERLDFKSGGYIQIDVPETSVDFNTIEVGALYREEWERMGIFGLKMTNSEPTFRAYSMANHPAEDNIIMLNIRIATPPWNRETRAFKNINPGICSSYIFSRKPGDKVLISGPYGEFFLKDTNREMMFIGGGAGMAPMRSHIFYLFHTLKTGRQVSFWYGARSKKEIFYEDDFKAIEKAFPNFKFTIALSEPLPEDHWSGATGFIHNVISDQYLTCHQEPEDIEYYLCGPPMMNEAVTKLLYNLGVPDEMVMYDDFGG